MSQDDIKHLDLLSIFHFVVGGITGLFSCMPIIHVIMGLLIVSGQFPVEGQGNQIPPQMVGWMFVIMGSLFIFFGWAMAICIIVAGVKLRKRNSWLYYIIIGGIECLFIPFGTILGVFTLIILNRESVKALFEQTNTAAFNELEAQPQMID